MKKSDLMSKHYSIKLTGCNRFGFGLHKGAQSGDRFADY
jgi:hypothetical protein